MAEAYCYNCKWCQVLELKSGQFTMICANDVNGKHPDEVGFFYSECDGYEFEFGEDC